MAWWSVFRAELDTCTVVATGGLAHLIAPVARTIEHVEPFLNPAWAASRVSTQPGAELMSEQAIPHRFDPTDHAGDLQKTYAELADGESTGVEVTVAGRLMLKRDQGRLVFGTLQDATGRIQLFAQEKPLQSFLTSVRCIR